MPEGPEIKRIADALRKQIAGRTIERIQFGLARLKTWENPLIGCLVKDIESRGKAL